MKKKKKYEPLMVFLAGLKGWETQITLTFEQIETIINDKLPKSAYGSSWWRNKNEGSRGGVILAHRIGVRQDLR